MNIKSRGLFRWMVALLFGLVVLVVPSFAQGEAVPVLDVAQATPYGLWALAMILLVIVVVVLSLLVAWLANNNVKLIDVPSVSTLVMGIVAEIGKFAFTQARLTTNPVDDEITLAVLRQFYTVTENEDGSLTLVQKGFTPATS